MDRWLDGQMEGWREKASHRLTYKNLKNFLKDGFVSRDTESLRIIYLFQYRKNPSRFAPAEYLYLINTVTTGSQFSIDLF